MRLDKVSRRDFLAATSVAAIGAAAISTGFVHCTKPTAVETPKSNYTFDITQSGYTALATVGGSAYCVLNNASFPAIVIRTGSNEVKAFSSSCTHGECPNDKIALPTGGIAVCPCHGSQFNSSGNIISGPASNQPTYGASISGNIVTVTG